MLRLCTLSEYLCRSHSCPSCFHLDRRCTSCPSRPSCRNTDPTSAHSRPGPSPRRHSYMLPWTGRGKKWKWWEKGNQLGTVTQQGISSSAGLFFVQCASEAAVTSALPFRHIYVLQSRIGGTSHCLRGHEGGEGGGGQWVSNKNSRKTTPGKDINPIVFLESMMCVFFFIPPLLLSLVLVCSVSSACCG